MGTWPPSKRGPATSRLPAAELNPSASHCGWSAASGPETSRLVSNCGSGDERAYFRHERPFALLRFAEYSIQHCASRELWDCGPPVPLSRAVDMWNFGCILLEASCATPLMQPEKLDAA